MDSAVGDLGFVAPAYLNRLGERAFGRPFVNPDASSQRGVWDPCLLGPLDKRLREALEGEDHVVALVSALLRPRGPPAVIWTVRAVIVDTVELVVWCRASAHVGDEVGQGLHPPVAHGDASAAVVGISLVGVRVASRDHLHPDSILGAAAACMGFAVPRPAMFGHAPQFTVGAER